MTHSPQQEFWNQRFHEDELAYGEAPNAFVQEQAHRLPAGARVLLPGDIEDAAERAYAAGRIGRENYLAILAERKRREVKA